MCLSFTVGTISPPITEMASAGKVRLLVLGAGYGTRLQRDLANSDGKYDYLLGVPKALLPVGRYDALVSHWLELMTTADGEKRAAEFSSSDFFIVSNDSSYSLFKEWAVKNHVPVENICNDTTTNNDSRLGACGDLDFAAKHFGWYDDESVAVMVMAGDTLLNADFSPTQFLATFNSLDSPLLTHYTCVDSDTLLTGNSATMSVPSLTVSGILELQEEGANVAKVLSLIEKPDPTSTPHRNACPCFYLLNFESLQILRTFLKETRDDGRPKVEWDATGKFIGYLCSRQTLHSFSISGRFDVGNLASYLQANDFFQ